MGAPGVVFARFPFPFHGAMGGASSIADASRDPIFLHEVPGKDKLMSALLNQSLKLTAGALRTRLRVDKLSLRAKRIDIFISRFGPIAKIFSPRKGN